MRFVFLLSTALGMSVWAAAEARGQAGRFIPLPRPPSFPGGGGGGFRFIPHLPWHGGGDSDGFWIVVAILGVIALAVVGWKLGQAFGRQSFPSRPPPQAPPLADLTLHGAEVEAKARKTTRLLEALAGRDGAFDPRALREFIASTFIRVQQSWEEGDYGPVRELFAPTLLAQHEELLRAMRLEGVINRIEDLRVLRLEFVHVSCPEETELHEVTALITFDAKVFFVHEGTGAFLRGSRKILPYQEFWVFRRQGGAWRLQAIERSHESKRLEAANCVSGMTDLDPRNAENGVVVL
jgi:hypothetical protein